MSKKETKKVEEVEVGFEEQDKTGWLKTYAIARPSVGVYQVYEVEFDPKKAKLIKTCAHREESNETFKIAIAKTGMLG